MLPVDVVEAFIRAWHPYAFCAPCVTQKLNLSERDAREALQALVVHPDFVARLRACYGCSQTVRSVIVKIVRQGHAKSLPRQGGDAHGDIAPEQHALGIEDHSVASLTSHEQSRLARICRMHDIAVCPVCSRKFKVHEMGADSLTRQYNLCPSCRVDLTPAVRRHIAECAVVFLHDPRWQAEVRETLGHALATRKLSSQLHDASELARVESEVLLARFQEAAEAARQTQQESERIKRKPRGGKYEA